MNITKSRESSLGGRKRLGSGGQKPAESTEEVDSADAGFEKGGGGCPDLVSDIIGGGSVVPVVWVGDVGDDIAHWEGVGRSPSQGGPQFDG